MTLIWQIIERLTALVIYVLLLLNVFNVNSNKFIDIIIIAQDSDQFTVFQLAK